MADVKGGVTGMAQAGEDTDKLRERLAKIGVDGWSPTACPVRIWEMTGDVGIPVRITASDMGPDLLSRLLGLTDTQKGVLNIVFRITDYASGFFSRSVSSFFVCIFLFQIAFGFALRFGEIDGASPFANYNLVFVAAVCICAIATHEKLPLDGLVRLSALAIIGGFLFISSAGSQYHQIAVALLYAGNEVFTIVSWIVLIAIASRSISGSVTVLAWGLGIRSFGSVVGAAFGVLCNGELNENQSLIFLIPCIMIMVFAAYMFFGMRTLSFTDTIKDIEPIILDTKPSGYGDQWDARCKSIGEQFGLSPRELEVFCMLARGRDRAYIEENLVISKNTVKAHVKHIYAKLGIHSHQELLDLLDV